LSSGLPVEEQYSVESIGPRTKLQLNHKRIGTAKNESLHRWVPLSMLWVVRDSM